MMSGSRHISRPRPSLSCETCQRRKVKCGKEQPTCSSCQRIGETCKYSSNPYKNKPNPSRTSTSTPAPSRSAQQEKWSIETPTTSAPFSSHEAMEVSAPLAEPSPFFTAPAFNEAEEVMKMSTDGSEPPTPGLISPTAFLQNHSRDWSDAFSITQPWLASLSQSIQQPITSPSTPRPLGDEAKIRPPPPKRHQSRSTSTAQTLEAITKELTDNDAITRTHAPVTAFPECLRQGTAHGRRESELHTGYMGSGNPATRPRYVESTFWALVNGHVSFTHLVD